MKRLLLPLILCACTFFLSACGEKAPTEVQNTQLIGRWSNEELGGDFNFTSDGKFRLEVDVSSILTIDSDGVAHLTDNDADYSKYCSFDGKHFSFNINGTDMLTMTALSDYQDNPFREYEMESGVLYDQFAKEGTSPDGKYYVAAKPGDLKVLINICDFVNDKDTVILSGSGLSAFTGDENTANNEFTYSVTDSTLTLKNDDETLVFSKIYRN